MAKGVAINPPTRAGNEGVQTSIMSKAAWCLFSAVERFIIRGRGHPACGAGQRHPSTSGEGPGFCFQTFGLGFRVWGLGFRV